MKSGEYFRLKEIWLIVVVFVRIPWTQRQWQMSKIECKCLSTAYGLSTVLIQKSIKIISFEPNEMKSLFFEKRKRRILSFISTERWCRSVKQTRWCVITVFVDAIPIIILLQTHLLAHNLYIHTTIYIRKICTCMQLTVIGTVIPLVLLLLLVQVFLFTAQRKAFAHDFWKVFFFTVTFMAKSIFFIFSNVFKMNE